MTEYARRTRVEAGMTDKIGADKDRLARRAVAAMGGWQTGMMDEEGWRLTSASRQLGGLWLWARGEDRKRTSSGSGIGPDLGDPATQGCLFARVRELHGVTEAEAVGYILDLMVTRACGYAEALVIGLEAGR